jgi:hypothetical protein
MNTVIPLGTFVLSTPWEIIQGAWVDGRAVKVEFSGSAMDHSVEAVFRFSTSPSSASVPSELLGHTLSPVGFKLKAIRQADGAATLKVTWKD